MCDAKAAAVIQSPIATRCKQSIRVALVIGFEAPTQLINNAIVTVPDIESTRLMLRSGRSTHQLLSCYFPSKNVQCIVNSNIKRTFASIFAGILSYSHQTE